MGKASVVYPSPLGTGVPQGGVILWSGAANAIPSGWALCNGANGTPDLRDRFVVGAGNTYAVGAKGGEVTHTLTVAEMPSHSHRMTLHHRSGRDSGVCPTSDLSSTEYTYDYTDNAGGGQSHENRPPYYALCYIMKL